MKTMITILLILVTLKVSAPPYRTEYITESHGINPYEAGLNATAVVESSGDLFAFNPLERAHGIFQIRDIRLRQYNNTTGSNYTEEDLYTYEVSREIYMYYASQIDYRNQERISREWNGWVRGMQKPSTVEYWLKVKAVMDRTPPYRVQVKSNNVTL